MTEQALLENKLIVFQIEQREYAISVQMVGSIEKLLPITRVPSTVDFIIGVINLRGVVTPVVDLKQRFYGKETIFTNDTRILVVHMEELTIGVIVDEANDVVDIDPTFIEQPPETIDSTVDAPFIDGVVRHEDRLLILVDLENALEMDAFKAGERKNG